MHSRHLRWVPISAGAFLATVFASSGTQAGAAPTEEQGSESLDAGAAEAAAHPPAFAGPFPSDAVQHDVSAPLRDLHPKQGPIYAQVEKPIRLVVPHGTDLDIEDEAVQAAPGPLVPITPGLNVAGVGDEDYGFSPDAAPPDTNGAVGATQYVPWVNESFAVFDKTTGVILLGPVAGNTLWSGFGSGCESNNDGDPIVLLHERVPEVGRHLQLEHADRVVQARWVPVRGG